MMSSLPTHNAPSPWSRAFLGIPASRDTIHSSPAQGGRRLAAASSRAISIRQVTSEADLELVFRFRYRIYVEEMHRHQRYANHVIRTIRDPLDKQGINLAAFRGNEIVGTVRINFPRIASVGEYESFYHMASVGADHPAHTSINTRFMIAPEFRKGLLAVKLALASFEYGAPRGIRWNFIDCNTPLGPFFKGLGYIEHAPQAHHPEYGLVTLMRLNVTDLAHLEAVRSPFARIAARLRSAAERSDAA